MSNDLESYEFYEDQPEDLQDIEEMRMPSSSDSEEQVLFEQSVDLDLPPEAQDDDLHKVKEISKKTE